MRWGRRPACQPPARRPAGILCPPLLLLLSLLLSLSPLPAQVRVKDKPQTNNVAVGAETNYILVEVTALGTNSTQLISVGHFVSNTLPALLNFTGNTATNNTVTNATRFGVFDQLLAGVFRYFGLEQGTNIVMYRNGSNIVINASAVPGSGGGALMTNETQFAANVTLTIGPGSRQTNNVFYGSLEFPATNVIFNGPIGSIVSWINISNYFGGRVQFAGMNPGLGKILTSVDADGNAGWSNPPVTAEMFINTNSIFRTDIANLQAGTNALHTRIGNAEAATNALHTRMGNAEAATNLISSKQHGQAALSNYVGTVGRNVTNVISLSTSNATSKPLTNAYGSGTLTLFGLEAGANITLTPNGSNIVVASTGGGGGGAYQTNAIAAGTQNTLNFTNTAEFLFVVTDQGGASRVDVEIRLQNDAVMFSKIQNISSDRILGRDTAGTGDIEELQLDGTSVEFNGSGTIRRSALTGDITATAGSATTDLANNAVEDSELRDSAGVSVIGRAANSTGDPADITAAANGYILQRSNSVVLFGRVNFTNDSMANARLLNAAGGSVLQYHDNTGILTNKAIDLTDSDSVTGILPLANSTTNFPTIASGSITVGGLVLTNGSRELAASMTLVGTNMWATGTVANVFSNVFATTAGGLTNILVEIGDGQTMDIWYFPSNGVNVGLPQFTDAQFLDGQSASRSNRWNLLRVTRRNTYTNLQHFTKGYELIFAAAGITATTNDAQGTITLNIAGVLTNLIGTTASTVTNENSAAIQINTGTLSLSPGNASNLVNNTSIDFQPGNVVTNLGNVVYFTQQPGITASNLVLDIVRTNRWVLRGLTNAVLTNIVEAIEGTSGDCAIFIENTTAVTMGVRWPAFGPQHGYYFSTNANNDVLSATSIAAGGRRVVTLTWFGTNVQGTISTW